MSKKVRRLFEQFRPEHYELKLTPRRDKMTFSGRVIIRGQKVGRPSQRLTLHQKDLKVTSAKLTRHDKKGDEVVELSRINLQKSYDELRLHAGKMIYPGRYTVELEFTGSITRPMNGLYPCFFKHEGKNKILIATQFESHHAREVFPCIDEPEAKATFDLTLVTPKGETIIANTPIKTQTNKSQLTTTVFETTPKMSTYLLAFVYGDMKYLEAKISHGVVVRTYATPDNIAHTKFALDCAVKILDFYNDYFGIKYPLEKCDMVALPDFASGAMENWGLITYREQALLVDPKNTSLPMKQYVAMVVAHELAHQWFGNLVTMRWWTDLWLNEGFASWIEYLAVNKLFPDWHMWTQFIVDEQEPGLRLDALENTHPVEVPIGHPDEIRAIFDNISYQKGSSVIHMLQAYLGAEKFRDGLRHYLKQHAYGNTDTVDLWAALEQASGKPVREFMHAWTSQPGFPIVQATARENELQLKQHCFCLNPAAKKNEELWPVPLNGQPDLENAVLNKGNANFALKKASSSYWLNDGHSGFYRTIYDAAHTAQLGELVKAGKLDEIDRLGLLSDAGEAAKAGYLPTVDVLNLLANYADEDSNVVWDIIVGLLGSIRFVMDDAQLRRAMKPFMRELVAKQLDRLGWEPKKNEPYFDSLLRPTILGLASLADEPAVVKEALKRFKAAKKSEDITPDLRGVVYGTAARKGAQAEFDKLLKFHNTSPSSEERVTLSATLSGFKQAALIERTLNLITSDDVRLQDATYWIAYSFMNRHASRATWDWLCAHWDWLEQNMGSDLSFYRFPNYAARAFSDVKLLPEFKKFFAAHMSPALERPVKQGIETIEWQAAWKKRDLASVKKFFKT
jgi:puromycin-sensitive aminopeptidase